MIYPSTSVYAANSFRWGSTALNAGATWDMTSAKVAISINENARNPFHAMGSRSYSHFGELGIPDSGLDAAGNRAAYPAFHRSKIRLWHGVNMYHGEYGPNYNSNWGENVFSTRTRTAKSWHIQKIVRNATGDYINFGNVANGPFLRTPFHTQYNIAGKHHDYPYAKSNDAIFYQDLPFIGSERANPMSKGASIGVIYGLQFSRFYHYHASLVEGPVGFLNHHGVNGAGKGSASFTYNVTADEPIARKAAGGRYASLEKISTWSPYSGAYALDFTNYNAYNKQLYKSSIWK